MDPRQALRDVLDAIADGEMVRADETWQDLIYWVEHLGGFLPEVTITDRGDYHI